MTEPPASDADSAPVAPPPEIQLREAHDRMRATLAALPDLLFVLDRAGRICDFHAPNPERLYVPPEKFLGRTMNEVLPEPAAGIVQRAIEDAAAHGHHRGSVYPLSTPAGEQWHEMSIAVQGDWQTPAGRLVAIVRDVTERKRTMDALRESEERFDQLARQSRTIIWEMDAAGLCTYVSPAVRDVLGYRPEDVIGKLRFYDLFSPADREAFKAAAFDIFRRREPMLDFENPCQTRDGRPVWVSTNAIPLLDAAGALRGYRGSVRDITDRKQTELALRESEQKFRLLTEGMKDVVWSVDVAAQRFLYVSPSVAELRGYTPAEILARPLEEAWVPEQREEFSRLLMGYVADFLAGRITEDTYVTLELLQPCKDGAAIPSEAVCHLVRNKPTGRIELHGVTRDIRERKRAEAAFRESEARFHNVARISRSYVWEIDANHLVTYVSPAVEDVLGYRPEEIVGRMHLYDFQPPECVAEIKRATLSIFRDARPVADFENPNRTKDGRLVWVSSSATPLFHADGSLRGYQGVDIDITERKRAEAALRQSEAKYRRLHEGMREAFVIADMEGRLMESNPAFEALIGYGRDEVARLHFADITPAKWRAVDARAIRRVLRNGNSEVTEKEYIRKDGTVVPVEMSGTLIRDVSGKPVGISAVIRDITERKRNEAELRAAHSRLEEKVAERTAALVASQEALAKSEEQFRQMAEIIPEVFWMIDARSGRALYISPAFEAIWGRPPRLENPGVFTWVENLHSEDRARALRAFKSGVKAGRFEPLEVRVLRPDGSVRWIEVRAWMIAPKPGEPRRVAGVMRDITDRRRLEAEILEAAEAERLRIGRDLHDSLGQSLTGIGYLAEALREDLASRGAREAADVQRLAKLIEEAAGKTHALAGGLLLVDLKRGGLGPALQELALRTQELFGVKCRYRGPVEVDRVGEEAAVQLYRIAQEAAANAAKHGKGKGIAIRLSARREGLLLSIRDTGRGLPPGPPKSGGMGLDIMRYRAGIIGAVFWIESKAGKGTAVNCLLPPPAPLPETVP